MSYLEELYNKHNNYMVVEGIIKRTEIDSHLAFSTMKSIKYRIDHCVENDSDLFDVYPLGSWHGIRDWSEMNDRFWESVASFKRMNGDSWSGTNHEKQTYFSELLSVKRDSYLEWLEYLNSLQDLAPEMFDWILRGVLSLGSFNSQTSKFNTRRKDDMNPYVYLYRDCLMQVIAVIKQKIENPSVTFEREALNVIFRNNNYPSFKTLYQYFYNLKIDNFIDIDDVLRITDGQWLEFSGLDDVENLLSILNNYPNLRWCIKYRNYAEKYLDNGSIYIYFSNVSDDQKYNEWREYGYPRLCIRTYNSRFAERPRGIGVWEKLDPFISETAILKDKIEEFGSEGDKFYRMCIDLEQYHKIYLKVAMDEELTLDDKYFILRLDPFFFGQVPDTNLMALKQCVLESDSSLELSQADLRHVDLQGVDFTNRSVTGLNLIGASLYSNTTFWSARDIVSISIDNSTRLPGGISIKEFWRRVLSVNYDKFFEDYLCMHSSKVYHNLLFEDWDCCRVISNSISKQEKVLSLTALDDSFYPFKFDFDNGNQYFDDSNLKSLSQV